MIIALAALAMALTGCAQRGPGGTAAVAKPDHPSKTVTLKTPVVYADSAHVRQAVRRECRLPQKLERFIKHYAAERNIQVDTSREPADQIQGQVLDVRITRVYAPGGGAFSGGKSVTIAGDLTENGKTLGDFKARRISGGGAFAAFKGTCDIAGRDVETLGKDVSTFLATPTEGARMGNM